MFEDSAHFDFNDDSVLGTSFTPESHSTQTSHSSQEQKRNNLDPIQGESKKLKVSCDYPSRIQKNETKNFKNFMLSNRCVKRKFPGPAGLLPERTASNKSISELIAGEESASSVDDLVLCSQRTNSAFEDGPWKEMTEDICVCKCNGEYLYEKFNIRWIKKQASLKKLLVNHKAPFLAAIVQSLEIFDGKVPTVNVTLKDSTGDIQGTILYSLYEEYSNFFTLGSVLVLKQFGVLSAGYNNHCLTITPNNLLTIYCLEVPKRPPDDTSAGASAVKNVSVKKVVVQECMLEEILKKYQEDALANSEQRQKSINFGRLRQNYDRLSRNNSDSENCSFNRLMLSPTVKNVRTGKNSSNLSPFQTVLNRSASDNSKPVVSNIPLSSVNRLSSHNVDVKKKFNFKGPVKQNSSGTLFGGQSERDGLSDRSENKASIIISSSQVSVTPDRKEHMDIWKNLLQDVDTESLFDDF